MAGSTTFDYAGESAVVTGSTKGIGRGIAAGLVAADANVVVNARTEADAADAVAELDELGAGEVTGVTADMADPADIARLVVSAIDAFG
jgi:3-oxoacyl-[acyl-carrier protein] reductase